MIENMEGEVFLFKMPRKTTSSVTYRLKVPSFFTLPEYDKFFEIDSPSFEFADATWCFRFVSPEKRETHDYIYFYIYLVRLHFKIRVQTVFISLILLDAEGNRYCNYGGIFKDLEGEIKPLSYDERFFPDGHDSLTYIIQLFVSTEVDVQTNIKVSDETGIRQHIEVNADQVSVITDRGILSLRQEFKDVLLNRQDYNLTFNVGDKQFQAHQDILRARSEVFRSMLSPEMLEQNNGVINVSDCEPEAFEHLLCYVYTGQVDISHANNMFDLYYAAHEYRLADLKDESCKFIMKSLTVTNVCKALELATRFFNPNFLDYVSNYFINNIDDILPTVEWQLFMKEHTTVANELFIKFRKQDVPRNTMEKSKDCQISLTELPSAAVSSASYTLKVPNFLILPEYDGVSFKLVSPFFKFANATWRFRCHSGDIETDEDEFISLKREKGFAVDFIRVNSEVPEQNIFYKSAILDADDEESKSDQYGVLVKVDGKKVVMSYFRNRDPSYDRRDTLTLIIHLFHTKPEEPNANQMPLATKRGFESLSQDFKDMLLNGQDHNLILNVRDKKFRAHRDILRARSDVFRPMLSHDMQENNSGVIDAHDCDPGAFEQLLCYIYTESVEHLDEENMFSLYYAADKYNLTYLKEACSDAILKSLTVNNVCDALDIATKHCDDDILYSATSYFLSNTDDILLTERWLLFLKEYPSVANELIIKSRLILRNTKP